MLLRSVTKHVKDQNWFAVFLDFFIVVAGILIAFQITNWNTERQRIGQEQDVLVSILEDIKTDHLELSSSLDMAKLNIDASNYALEQAGLPTLKTLTMPIEDITALSGFEFEISPPREFTPEQRMKLWSLSIFRLHAIQAESAFETLVAAGDLSIIRNADLIRDMQLYNQQWKSLELSQIHSYRPYRDQALYVGQEFGLSPFSEIEEAEYIAILKNSPKLSGALRTVLEYGVIHNAQQELVDQQAVALIELLEKEIK